MAFDTVDMKASSMADSLVEEMVVLSDNYKVLLSDASAVGMLAAWLV